MKKGDYIRIVRNDTPCAFKVAKADANGRVLEVGNDYFTAHYIDNYNTRGDFRTELMRFSLAGILDIEDEDNREKIRAHNCLMPLN